MGPLHFLIWGGQNGNYKSANRHETHHQTPQKRVMTIAFIRLQYSVLTTDLWEEFWSKMKFFWDGADIHDLLAMAFCRLRSLPFFAIPLPTRETFKIYIQKEKKYIITSLCLNSITGICHVIVKFIMHQQGFFLFLIGKRKFHWNSAICY